MQKEYPERKKAKEGVKYFQKERARQKKNYTKVKDLSKKELKSRSEAVKLRVQKHCLSVKQLLDTSECSRSLSCSSTSLSTPEPSSFLVAMKFPKRGESSKKRKRRSDDHFYKKIAKLEEERKALKKSNAIPRQRVHQMKKKKQEKDTDHLTPRKSVPNLLKSGALSPRKTSKYIKQSLLFSKVVSKEIRASVLEQKNKKESIRRLVSEEILRKYKLIKYASEKTGNNRRKKYRSTRKILHVQAIRPQNPCRNFEILRS